MWIKINPGDAGGVVALMTVVAGGIFAIIQSVIKGMQKAREKKEDAHRDEVTDLENRARDAANTLEQQRLNAIAERDKEEADRRKRWEAQMDRFQASLQNGYDRAVAENEKARTEHEAVRSRLHGLEQRIPVLEDRVEDLETQLTAARAEALEARSEATQIKARLGACETDLSYEILKSGQMLSEIAGLHGDLASAKRTIELLQEENVQLKEQIGAMPGGK